ncbi:MAG: cytochrome c peroxidase [Putridiphycobacter sp.]|nr:cytochrome c peroxidase [Putridiphycobacter sp.]
MFKYPIWIILAAILIFGFTQTKKPTAYLFPKLQAFPPMPVNPTNLVTIEGVELGRYLFYDPILSSDSSIACATCHQQAFAFSDGHKRFSEGINNTKLKRNTPALFNLAWNEALFWDGKAENIEHQVFFPVTDHQEMDLNWQMAERRLNKSTFYRNLFLNAFGVAEIDSVLVSKAIAQFERTILSYNTRLDRALRREVFLTKEELKGLELLNDQSKGNCLHCHPTDANFVGSTGKFSNNGLDVANSPSDYKDKGRGGVTGIPNDMGLFKIPSLRNIAVTAPYMHDGRFNTLEEVLDFYTEGVNKSINIDSKMHFSHATGVSLSAEEKKQIIIFLNALTDSVLISSKAFANPFDN